MSDVADGDVGGAGSRARAWCFTLNNWTQEEYNVVVSCSCRYLIVGKEIGESGTPHLQGYVCFRNARRLVSVKEKLGCNRVHVEVARGTAEQNQQYCSKEGDFVEVGEIPVSQKRKGEMEIERWARARDLAKAGKFEEIDGDIYVRCLRNLEQIFRKEKLSAQLADNSEMVNEWIWGPTGCGKSSSVRTRFGDEDLYSKPLNKWWDDYNGERVVLLEDVDPSHEKWIGYFLKVWSDHYKFRGEYKGGSMMLRPKSLIITSQYSIDQIFSDHETVSALHRRFKQMRMIAGGVIVQPARAP